MHLSIAGTFFRVYKKHIYYTEVINNCAVPNSRDNFMADNQTRHVKRQSKSISETSRNYLQIGVRFAHFFHDLLLTGPYDFTGTINILINYQLYSYKNRMADLMRFSRTSDERLK